MLKIAIVFYCFYIYIFQIIFVYLLIWWLVAEETPVLIPNTAVKLSRGDDTLRGKVASRQFRGYINKKHTNKTSATSLIGPRMYSVSEYILRNELCPPRFYLCVFCMYTFCYTTYMSWGTKKRNTIITIFFVLVLAIISTYLFTVFYKPPSCFDNKQNADEAGVDCGGSCELVCKQQVIEPIVHWRRLFEVGPGVYNVLAYVENPNPTAGVEIVPYTFGIYDNQNVLLEERTGAISLAPKAIVPIVENTLVTGKLQANRVSFKLDDSLIWKRREPEAQLIVIEDEELIEPTIEPRIEATLRNLDVRPLDNVRVVVIVYDIRDNAIASSSTRINRIPANGSSPVFFTWPQPFSDTVGRFEIIPVYERVGR